MAYTVAALYQFLDLPDYARLREPLRDLARRHGLCGSILLASEGINGTIAGAGAGLDTFLMELRELFGGRLDRLELKFSQAALRPFDRMKVRLKKEIVTLGDPQADPLQRTGTYVAAEDWNDLIRQDDVLLLDTRNAFEVAMGSFEGAQDPGLASFGDFRAFVRTLDPQKHRRIAMFCTGGIRCEKASAHMLALGFEEVYQLKGGILQYLAEVPPEQSLWRGSCFVFDQRVALGHGLAEAGPTTSDSTGETS